MTGILRLSIGILKIAKQPPEREVLMKATKNSCVQRQPFRRMRIAFQEDDCLSIAPQGLCARSKRARGALVQSERDAAPGRGLPEKWTASKGLAGLPSPFREFCEMSWAGPLMTAAVDGMISELMNSYAVGCDIGGFFLPISAAKWERAVVRD